MICRLSDNITLIEGINLIFCSMVFTLVNLSSKSVMLIWSAILRLSGLGYNGYTSNQQKFVNEWLRDNNLRRIVELAYKGIAQEMLMLVVLFL